MSTQYLLEERSIPVPRQLAAAIGLEEATVFQQLWYCIQNPNMLGKRDANNQKWIRNPIECQDVEKQQRAQEHGKDIDWLSNFPFLTRYRIRRVFSKLEELGLVISRKLRASKWDHCKYYTIDNGKLAELLKALKISICRFSTHPFVENLQMDVTTANKSYQIHNSTISFQDIERETVAVIEKQEEGEEPTRDLELRFDKKSESCTQPEVLKLDKCSATAELAETELNNFKTQLEDLGKKLGRHSPMGWAFKIVQNLRDGKASTYWNEFKAGIPLGTSEQQEWEIAPGVACTIVIQCLQQEYLSKPGTTPQEAALKAARTIARPKEMAAVWESIKAQVMFRRSEWQRQSELGVRSPVLDSWMMPKPAVSVKEVAIALIEIQSALPEVFKSRSEFSQSQELKALQGQTESALTQIETSQLRSTVSAVVESLETESAISETPANSDISVTIAAAKAKISAVLSKFARPSNKQAILEANIAEVKNAGYTAPVAKVPSSGGLADYLRQIEADINNSW